MVQLLIHVRLHHAHKPPRGYRQGILCNPVRRSANFRATTSPRARSSRPSSPSTARSAWDHALGLRLPDNQGAEARADQRTGRDVVHVTDVPRRLSTASLPRRGRRVLRMQENHGRRRTPFLMRFRSGRPFGFAGILSMRHGETGSRLATCAITSRPTNELDGQDPRPDAGELASGCA